MFIKKNNKLLKIIANVAVSSVIASTAVAGGMQDEPPQNNNTNYPTPMPDTHQNGQFEQNLLPQNNNYPEVGLRKEMSKDCYCEGGYMSVGGGYVFPTADVDANGVGRFDVGKKINGHVGAGYKFANFRVDVLGEYSHQRYTPNDSTSGTRTIKLEATNRAYTGMMNAYYDFDINNSPISPYVGLGIGMEKVKTKFDLTLTDGAVITPAYVEYEKDLSFVGAAMAGVAFRVSKEITLDVGYKLKNIQSDSLNLTGIYNKAKINNATGSTIIDDSGLVGLNGTEYEDILNHEIKASIRYRF